MLISPWVHLALPDPDVPVVAKLDPFLKVVIRSGAPLETLTSAVTSAVSSAQPGTILEFQTLNVLIRNSLMRERLMAMLSGFFGLLAGLLARRGHRVTIVENGKQALDALERTAFDLVLMDLQMPEMGGLEATAAIRARERKSGRHIRIVAMTVGKEADAEKELNRLAQEGFELVNTTNPAATDGKASVTTVHFILKRTAKP